MHIEKSCDCGRNRADRYVRAGVSQRTAPAMISRTGGSETGVVPKQSGTLLATTTGTLNDTPALDAPKASCGAPISMGRGEIPVRLAATSRLFCLKIYSRKRVSEQERTSESALLLTHPYAYRPNYRILCRLGGIIYDRS